MGVAALHPPVLLAVWSSNRPNWRTPGSGLSMDSELGQWPVEFKSRDCRSLRGGPGHKRSRNCCGVSPAFFAIPPIVIALMGLCLGMTMRVLPLVMMICPLWCATRKRALRPVGGFQESWAQPAKPSRVPRRPPRVLVPHRAGCLLPRPPATVGWPPGCWLRLLHGPCPGSSTGGQDSRLQSLHPIYQQHFICHTDGRFSAVCDNSLPSSVRIVETISLSWPQLSAELEAGVGFEH